MSENEKGRKNKTDGEKVDRIIWVNRKPTEVKRKVFNGHMREKWRDIKRRKQAREHPEKQIKVESLEALEEQGRGIAAPETTEGIVEKKDLSERLSEAVLKLAIQEQEIIDAYYMRGLSEPQISAETGVPQRTINDRRRAALKKLRKYLE